jgi:hypothetical protein
MKRAIRYIGLPFLAVLLFGSFQAGILLTPLMQTELETRLQAYRDEQWAVCHQRALERANHEVDSLIIVWAKANRDTLGRPPIPVKPEEPERLAPKDSTPIAPLFLPIDTLN